jgi:5-methylcytosine-specific restriction protein A
MPKSSLKPCQHPRCPELIDSGSFCVKHQPVRKEKSAARRGYDRAWNKVREVHLGNQPVCEICGAYNNLEVHHIKPIKEGGQRLSLNNLQTLCHDCHNKVHSRFNSKCHRVIDPRTGLEAV